MQSHRGSSQALPAHIKGEHKGSADPTSTTARASDLSTHAAATSSDDQTPQASDASVNAQQATGPAPGEQKDPAATEQQGNQESTDQCEGGSALDKDSAKQSADKSANTAAQSNNGRTAHFASLAEQADIRQAPVSSKVMLKRVTPATPCNLISSMSAYIKLCRCVKHAPGYALLRGHAQSPLTSTCVMRSDAGLMHTHTGCSRCHHLCNFGRTARL